MSPLPCLQGAVAGGRLYLYSLYALIEILNSVAVGRQQAARPPTAARLLGNLIFSHIHCGVSVQSPSHNLHLPDYFPLIYIAKW